MSLSPTQPTPEIADRGRQLIASQLRAIYRRTNRLFMVLMVLQWVAGIVAALWISPRTWAGAESAVHLHVWLAVFLGGAITSFPLVCSHYYPDAAFTRHVTAIAQMLWSSLLIHLTGGRIETHFHVFGSLALLAWYRDVHLLMTATLLVASDHFVRGLFWPESVYGVAASTLWRTLEHAGWVLFEDVFLWISIKQSLVEMHERARHHAGLESNHEQAKAEVQSQFKQLQGAEERLRQAQKMEAIGQLAGGVAHDFNNLLTIIGGYSELVLARLRPGIPFFDEISEVKRAADRASSLTKQLLAFSRQQILAPRLIDLNELVQELDKMLRRLIGEDIQLTTHLDPEIGQIRADPGQINQVIMNLVVNARDAIEANGQISIQTQPFFGQPYDVTALESDPAIDMSSGRQYVQLTITDTGAGMDAATRRRIFEPFFTTKGIGKGTGLGLATVYGIVRQSGGIISVYSEVGQGTTFKIYFPRVFAQGEETPSSSTSLAAHRGKETIMLVEDEEKLRCFARQVLESSGYKVIEACDGQQALELSQTKIDQIDLLLTDVVMPHLGGRQLAEHLQAVRPNLKVIYMSGYTDDAILRHGILAAQHAFVQKPFSLKGLLSKVRETLDEEKALAV